jgi:hypothetical protein
MAIRISVQTQTLLQEQAGRLGQKEDALADALLLSALRAASADYEETCQAIAEGLADISAGRTVSFEAAHVQWEQQKAAHIPDALTTETQLERKTSLEQHLAGVTEDNLHGECITGATVGSEAC